MSIVSNVQPKSSGGYQAFVRDDKHTSSRQLSFKLCHTAEVLNRPRTFKVQATPTYNKFDNSGTGAAETAGAGAAPKGKKQRPEGQADVTRASGGHVGGKEGT